MTRRESQLLKVSVRIPRAHWQALQERASDADRTVSAELRRLIRQSVEKDGRGTGR